MSWSETGAASRPTDFVPSWSAIVGLVGAALGWGRTDQRLVRFANDYALAVAVENPGERIQDYHTIQSPEKSQAEAMRAQTRADELSVASVHTTITRREYVSGAAYTVLLLADSDSPIASATEIAAGLGRPVFPLYAGRRSCALGRVAAEVVAGNLDDLLPGATHWDHRLASGRSPSLIRERRDQRVGPFAFTIRHECVA